MKLWQKNTDSSKQVEEFTAGRDREMDQYLASFDILGSIAHVTMLETVGLLNRDEKDNIVTELRKIYSNASEIRLHEGVEDIHSHIEFLLTEKLGETGKKIHAARSRNDQVLLDLKLFLREELGQLVNSIVPFFELLQQQSEKFKDDLLPGYSHLQLAMPSSFGLWFGAYAESLVDDLITIKAAYDITNKNPLGSAAGYGSSFPINRKLTTELLGFENLDYNVVYAQMGRGKTERIVAMAISNVADTLARFAMDACLYLNQHFGFISFPDELTTGSSIMPHKKNPDVFELVRATCNRIKSLPNEIMMITTNLPSGYHRDLQIIKEHIFPAFGELRNCLEMTSLMIASVQVKKDILVDEKYQYLFSVEEVNRLVNEGMSFREAYRKVGMDIESGNFQPGTQKPQHTHEGSIGNLSNDKIREKMEAVLQSFPFEKVRSAMEKLVKG